MPPYRPRPELEPREEPRESQQGPLHRAPETPGAVPEPLPEAAAPVLRREEPAAAGEEPAASELLRLLLPSRQRLTAVQPF